MNGSRLRELRRRAGLSQTELADQLGVDTSLVSRWEKGEREPSPDQQSAFARVIGVSLDYLLHGESQKAQFLRRAGYAQDAEEKDVLRKSLLDAEQQIYYLESAFNMAKKNPSPFVLGFNYTPAQLERIADTVRDVLRLNARISFGELKQALTEQNVFVFEWGLPDKISGLSYRGNISVVFINHRHQEGRRLFTLAHEMAHLLFHLGEGREAEAVSLTSARNPQEKEANDFASELLMPKEIIRQIAAKYKKELKQPSTLNSLARFFNVSPPAMFYRLVNEKVYRWQEKSLYFESHKALDSVQITFRVSDDKYIARQVAPEFLKLALELYDTGKIPPSKLSEWFFCSHTSIERFLSQREARSDDEQWLEAWVE
jgi:Zn-dependent peptidase ImmA (M78 family)/DNA-binding transcriptional regulator YiaG